MRIVYAGSGDIGLPSLRWLLDSPAHDVVAVVTQPDKPAGRALELTPPPVKVFAAERGIPVLQPRRLRDPAAVEELRAFQPEVIVVMAYGQILPSSVLQMPSIACLNLHASILPRHRGAAPIQAAILSGDRASGITVMYMDEGLDTGDILLTRTLPIRRRETGGSLHDCLAELAPETLREALELLGAGRAPRVPQDAARATHMGKLTREHGEIDWTKPAREIERHIRAMNPWPCAWTTLPDESGPKRIKVFSAIAHRRTSGSFGSLLRADRHGLLVGAGEGAVLLREIQPEGKRRMAAGDFAQGRRLTPGMLLGAVAIE